MTNDSLAPVAHAWKLVRETIPPMHPGGKPVVAGIATGALALRQTLRLIGMRRAGSAIGRAGIAAAAASALFFRMPQRVPPSTPGLIVCPADGLVSLITEAAPPPETGLGPAPRPRVSIFLSLLDVHVQWVPAAGTVRAVHYHPGAFLSADLDKASDDNERNSIVIDTPSTPEPIVVTQIAGLLARRIVCDVTAEDRVDTGDVYGLIRFGSRLDTYLPVGATPLVGSVNELSEAKLCWPTWLQRGRDSAGGREYITMTPSPAVRFLPNAITVLAVSSGMTSIAFAMQTSLPGHFTYAIGAIAVAAILDSLDGPAARLLRSQSRIGAELDSLSDAISFGVAPALLLYIWALEGQTLGWAACVVYTVCTVLRLARFNSLLDTAPKPWAKSFFTGVPSPAAALLAIMPLLATIRFGDGFWSHPWVVGVWAVLMGLLMVSRLPTIALKSVRTSPRLIVPMLILLVAGVAALFYEPHLILLLGLLVYLLHIPYAGWKYQYLRHRPELWAEDDRRIVARANRRRLRLAERMPRRRRVAGRAPDGSPLTRQRRLGRRGDGDKRSRHRIT